MYKYIIKRLIMLIPIIFAIVLISFVFLYAMPGDRAALYMNFSGEMERFKAVPNPMEAYAERYYELRAQMGLDDPFLMQLFRHFQGMARPYLGIPIFLWDAFRITLLLAFSGFVLTMAIGVPLGVVCAGKRNVGKFRFDSSSFLTAAVFSAI